MGLDVQFSDIKSFKDFQTEFLELFMQQKYEIIIFPDNNLLEMYKINEIIRIHQACKPKK